MLRACVCISLLAPLVCACAPDKPEMPLGDASHFVVTDCGPMDGRIGLEPAADAGDGSAPDTGTPDSTVDASAAVDQGQPDLDEPDTSRDSEVDATGPDQGTEDAHVPADTTAREGGQQRGRG